MPVQPKRREIHISVLADIYGGMLTARQLDFLREYFDCDLSYAEIAQKHNLARQTVKDAVTSAECNLRQMEKKLGFYKRQNTAKQLLDEAKQLIGESESQCGGCKRLKEVLERLYAYL